MTGIPHGSICVCRLSIQPYTRLLKVKGIEDESLHHEPNNDDHDAILPLCFYASSYISFVSVFLYSQQNTIYLGMKLVQKSSEATIFVV